ncbi:hypothetical protein LIER_32231 [Lithospermum erythrorhizon]|uniref:Integrase zinc-binding domain-containing protein n=1 Tax=Lithospermum erythrorhizon TaxID=34254 RepID=A0AAV3RV22_LITER
MSFDLCNVHAIFQRYIFTIFSNMIQKFIEVTMDEFSMFGESFENFLDNLNVVLKRRVETNLTLSWEKYHFMVKQGTGLAHIVSQKDIEVDRAKIDVISKLPPPNSVKGIRSFLGHSGFYRKFIKVFKNSTNDVIGGNLIPINESLPHEQLYDFHGDEPWFADFVNFLASGIALPDLRSHEKKRFLSKVRHFYLDDPYLFKHCPGHLIRWCIPEVEQEILMSHSHALSSRGHFGGKKIALNVLQAGFYWPSLFKDAIAFGARCDRCQRTCNLGKRNGMPLIEYLVVELFDVCEIDFMGHFPNSCGFEYIFVAVDYVY